MLPVGLAGTPMLHIASQTSTKYLDRKAGTVHAAYDQLGSALSLSGNQLLWCGAAALDQVHLDSLGIARSATTCAATPNSSGAAAALGVEGCDSVLANALTLTLGLDRTPA